VRLQTKLQELHRQIEELTSKVSGLHSGTCPLAPCEQCAPCQAFKCMPVRWCLTPCARALSSLACVPARWWLSAPGATCCKLVTCRRLAAPRLMPFEVVARCAEVFASPATALVLYEILEESVGILLLPPGLSCLHCCLPSGGQPHHWRLRNR